MDIKLLITIFTAIGGLILFVSWISENYLQKKWEGQKEVSERTRQELSKGEDRHALAVFQVDLFYSSYIKEGTENSLRNYIKALVRYSKNLLAMQMHRADILAIDDATYQKDHPIKKRLEIARVEKLIDTYASQTDVEAISQLADELSDEMRNNNTKAVQEANLYLLSLNKRIFFYNGLFLWSYIAGSILLGVAFLLDFFA